MRLSLKPGRTSRVSCERGVALVITLSFLLISTAIVVAFLLRSRSDVRASASYSASVQSDLLAAGAMDNVVADFLGEIAKVDNSTLTEVGDFKWFEPVRDPDFTYPSMLPQVTANVSNSGTVRNTLVRQSLGGQNSSLNSDKRPVSAVRWDLPRLLLDPSGTAPGYFSDSDTPAWIYVAENGSPTNSPSGIGSFPIAGRYAYNVYEVGGLLNVNVAGHRSGTSPKDLSAKGALAFADLTQIPGLQNAVDNLIEWRAPYVNWAVLGDPNNPISGSSLTIMDYLRMGSTSGWMKNPSNIPGDKGNQFLSRRDLLKYADQNGFADALPFLTHFSVDADAPSFNPDTEFLPLNWQKPSQDSATPSRAFNGDRVSYIIESLSGDSNLQSNDRSRINPPRFATNTVIEGLQLPNGDSATVPVLHKRFPLSRLALVQTDPSARSSAGSSAQLVSDYFGLVSVDGYTWQYPDTRIKTLDQVAAEKREPNFFELLKSVIQVGSLGQYRHPIPKNNPTQGALEPGANRIDEHILRIGAAIIDQADADSYPTRIRFNYDPSTSFGEIYGVEDLPYLHSLRFVGYGKPNQQRRHWFMAQPSLWNPHNPERRTGSTSDFPSQYRITTLKPYGNIAVTSGSNASAAGQFAPGTAVTFSWSPDSYNFRQPQGLLSPVYPAGANLSGGQTVALHTDEKQLFTPLVVYPTDTAIGFIMGQNADADSNADRVSYSGGTAQFLLQYQAGGNFYTYDRLWFAPQLVQHENHQNHVGQSIFTSLFSGRERPLEPPGGTLRSEAGYFKTDPRSQRFLWPSDIMSFTGPAPWNFRRYMMAEGTGPGWYGGLYTMFTPSGAGVTGGDMTRNYIDLWRFGNHRNSRANGSHDWGLREDLGFLSINSKKQFEDRGNFGMYYTDHDSVTRRAMAGATNVQALTSIFGQPPTLQSISPPTTTGLNRYFPRFPMPMQMNALPSSDASSADSTNKIFYPNRPIVLNRPFRSVGELAHAFRDVPWKNVDFSFQESGDTGLLDVFTIFENEGQADSATPLVAGKVNLNIAPAPVLKALLKGVAKDSPIETSGTPEVWENDSDLEKLATRIAQYRSTTGTPNESENGVNGPLRSLAELVGRVYSGSGGQFSDSASFVGLRADQFGSNNEDQVRPERMAAIARSLADVGTTRSWNFMIDLVAQSGRITDNSLTNFNVASESRWWLFISIDRFTGKILARSIERVVE